MANQVEPGRRKKTSQGGDIVGFFFPFLGEASHLVTWRSGDLGEDPPLPPTHSETLGKSCLLPGAPCPHLYNWVSHSLLEADSLGEGVRVGSAVLEVSSGLKVHAESREGGQGFSLGEHFHSGPGLPGPEGPSHLPQPSPATSLAEAGW